MSGRPQEAQPEPSGSSLGSLLQQGGSFLDKNKQDILSTLGLAAEGEQADPKQMLATVLGVSHVTWAFNSFPRN